MKPLVLSSILFMEIVNLSCGKDVPPATTTVYFLDGTWTGRITFTPSIYPLSLTLNQVRNDSLTGRMVIGFSTPETTQIRSALFLSTDSLYFALNRGGFCSYRTMWGKVVTSDSLAGWWTYRCINDPPSECAWSARRMN